MAAGIALAGLGACKRDWISIPSQPSALVVHGVLNRVDTMQLVLVERTVTGAVYTPMALPFSSIDPITTDYGVAESNAITAIIGPDGAVYDGHEVPSCHGYTQAQIALGLCNGTTGAGVYKFYLKGAAIVPGATYALRVTTTAGEVVSAQTVMPAVAVAGAATTVAFNRATDTLALSWANAPSPAYQVRVDNVNGPWSSFTDSSRVSLTGALRNPEDPQLRRVFLPGSRHLVTVTAVDANVYDYYRTSNNSFVGYGNVSRVKGALGVFGSAVLVVQRTVAVSAPQTRPIEGIWDAVDSGLGYMYWTSVLNLYVESPAEKKGEADVITGNYQNANPALGLAMSGTFKDGRLNLTMPGRTADGRDAETLVAELRGDTLVGTYARGAPAKFVKRK